MKRILCFMYDIILVISLVGCSVSEKNFDYNIMECTSSYDNIEGARHNKEFTFADSLTSFINSNVPDKVSVTSVMNNGLNVDAVYRSSKIELQGWELYNEYFAEATGECYTFDTKGKLVRYMTSPSFYGSKIDDKACTAEKSIEVANKFISSIINISDYTVSVEYDEEANKYFVYYNKQINGIEASDFAYVSVNDSGCVTSYYSNMLGKVPADIAVNFNIETVKKKWK